MAATAVFGASVGWVTYEAIYYVNPMTTYKSTVSWLVGFIVGVVRQHGLHRWMTFPYGTPYWNSLGKAYLLYSTSALVGSVTIFHLTENLGMHHRTAWLICLGITALTSILCLRRFVFVETKSREGMTC
jgi:hypothetical protein